MRRAAALLVALCTLAGTAVEAQDPVSSPSPSPSPSPADPVTISLDQARRLIDEGRPSAALEVLRSAPTADPRVRVLTAVARYHA
ncbi:MAG TPA: hypothetical protein VFE68_04625, partial [Vicinamibacteria bacterium]|nr:hypothetical protein [Vicinamibacteria bacterium]